MKPNAVKALTHVKKNAKQTGYLIWPTALRRPHSICLPWCQFKIWMLIVGTAAIESLTAIFGCSSIHVTRVLLCSLLREHNDWWSSEGGSWERDKPSREPSMIYRSPSHQRMHIALALFKIKSEIYFFSLLFLIFFTNRQEILSLACTNMYTIDR